MGFAYDVGAPLAAGAWRRRRHRVLRRRRAFGLPRPDILRGLDLLESPEVFAKRAFEWTHFLLQRPVGVSRVSCSSRLPFRPVVARRQAALLAAASGSPSAGGSLGHDLRQRRRWRWWASCASSGCDGRERLILAGALVASVLLVAAGRRPRLR